MHPRPEDRVRVEKRPIEAAEALNEAYCYERPSAFSRGMRVEMGDCTVLFISGTASVGAEGESLHAGDFRAQARRMFDNVTALLASEGADWHDMARTTIYIADMRDYAVFNEVRCEYYDAIGLDPYPASTCVEARICRPELLVEMDAIAVLPRNRD
jgi:enamine deaminase RidA (YjgF/YER057c/UK114 family)